VFCELLNGQGSQMSGAGVLLSLESQLKRIDLGRYRPMLSPALGPACSLSLAWPYWIGSFYMPLALVSP
jgi:hypothetical protein